MNYFTTKALNLRIADTDCGVSLINANMLLCYGINRASKASLFALGVSIIEMEMDYSHGKYLYYSMSSLSILGSSIWM